MFISETTLDDLMRRALERILKRGTHLQASRGPNRELTGVLLRLTNPRARLSHTEKKGKVFSALGEFAWYLAGSNDGKFISYYIKAYEKEAERDGTIHGAYGPRLFGPKWHQQFNNVVELLRAKPTTRKAVIQLFDAKDLTGPFKDVPCTCSLQFMRRSGVIDMVTMMRSNDVFKGLPHDVFAFTMLQEIVARMLCCELGTYAHFAGSLHLYDKNAAAAQKFLDEGWQDTEVTAIAMPAMPMGDPWPALKVWSKCEAAIRRGRSFLDDKGRFKEKTRPSMHQIESLDPYWHDLIRLLEVFASTKNGNRSKISRIRRQMSSAVYKEYISKREKPTRTAPRTGQPTLFEENSEANREGDDD